MDIEIITRVISAIWFHPDSAEMWRAHVLAKDVLSGVGLDWLGMLDADPPTVIALLDCIDRDGEPTDDIVGLVCQQIDRGGTTIGLDVSRMAEHCELAVRVPRVLELRGVEMEQVKVSVLYRNRVDLRALWLTAYGHSVLSAMDLGTTCSAIELKQVRQALNRIGFRLRRTKRAAAITDRVSVPLREYIWKLADVGAKRRR